MAPMAPMACLHPCIQPIGSPLLPPSNCLSAGCTRSHQTRPTSRFDHHNAAATQLSAGPNRRASSSVAAECRAGLRSADSFSARAAADTVGMRQMHQKCTRWKESEKIRSLEWWEAQDVLGVEVADYEGNEDDETRKAEAARLLLVDGLHAHVCDVCCAPVLAGGTHEPSCESLTQVA